MNTPDLTKAQILAAVKLLIALAAVIGFKLDAAQSGEILGVAGTLAGLLVYADAHIRGKRADNAIQIAKAIKKDPVAEAQELAQQTWHYLQALEERVSAVEKVEVPDAPAPSA